VSKGVVSALDRVIEERLEGTNTLISISGAIQTDAAINPGNSGGPLLDLEGRVVGINTAGLVGGIGRPVQGISFAVSSQVAQPIVTALIETGRVERGWIGIGARTVNRDIAQANQLGVDKGAVLVQVVPGSPAERAGLRTRDVITKIGDQEITNVGDITNALVHRGPGERVTVEYVRGSDRQTTELTLGEPPRG
jgi:S1-C subfamily serine protease